MDRQDAERVAERAAEALGPEAGLVASLDPVSLARAAAELDPRWRGKAELATQLLIDAMAPSNFLGTNPAALKRAFDTGGRSAAQGVNNILDDLVSKSGKPRPGGTT